jgi:hypothetical protein
MVSGCVASGWKQASVGGTSAPFERLPSPVYSQMACSFGRKFRGQFPRMTSKARITIVAADAVRAGSHGRPQPASQPPFLEPEGWCESVVANPAAEAVREIDGAHSRVARSDRSRRSSDAVSGQESQNTLSDKPRSRSLPNVSRGNRARWPFASWQSPCRDDRPLSRDDLDAGRQLRQLSQDRPPVLADASTGGR